MSEVREVLSTLELFDGVSEDGIERLVTRGRVERWQAGKMVIEEGMGGPRLLVLLEGSVEVLRRDADGIQRVLATVGPGSCLGEMSLLLDRPRTATVRATHDLRAFVIDKSAFLDLVDAGDPAALRVGFQVARALAGRLLTLNERTVELLRRLDLDADRLDALGHARQELFTLWDY